MDSFGSFANCIVNGDTELLRGERKLRGFGFAVSVTVQLAILIALILVPILTPAMLPKLLSVVQVPVYRPRPTVDVIPARPVRAVTQPAYIPTFTSRPALTVSRPTSDFTSADDVVLLGPGASESMPDILAATRPAIPPPPPPMARGPVKVGSGVMEALLINRVEPRYPPIARAAHVSGAVVLSAVIAVDGTIQS
jgi:protein TonB